MRCNDRRSNNMRRNDMRRAANKQRDAQWYEEIDTE